MPCYDNNTPETAQRELRSRYDLNELEAEAFDEAVAFRKVLIRLAKSGQCCPDCQRVVEWANTVVGDFISYARNQWKSREPFPKSRLRLVQSVEWEFIGDHIPPRLQGSFASKDHALRTARDLDVLVRDKDGEPFQEGQ